MFIKKNEDPQIQKMLFKEGLHKNHFKKYIAYSKFRFNVSEANNLLLFYYFSSAIGSNLNSYYNKQVSKNSKFGAICIL